MKDLFKSRFPYVELPNEQLSDEQIAIKEQYQDAYIQKEEKADKLRKVHGNESAIGKRTE